MPKEAARDLHHIPNTPPFLLYKLWGVPQPEGSQICAQGTSTRAPVGATSHYLLPEPRLAKTAALMLRGQAALRLPCAVRTQLRAAGVGSMQAAVTQLPSPEALCHTEELPEAPPHTGGGLKQFSSHLRWLRHFPNTWHDPGELPLTPEVLWDISPPLRQHSPLGTIWRRRSG